MSIPVAPQYIADFEQLGFGMFVHWGLYSQLGRGEWIYHIGKLDANEYKKLKDRFTAEDEAFLEKVAALLAEKF